MFWVVSPGDIFRNIYAYNLISSLLNHQRYFSLSPFLSSLSSAFKSQPTVSLTIQGISLLSSPILILLFLKKYSLQQSSANMYQDYISNRLSLSVKITQLCMTLHDPMYCWPARLLCSILQARILVWVAVPFLQGIFSIQGSNPGLLHCRPILYHLRDQGSPITLSVQFHSVTQSCPTLCDPTDCQASLSITNSQSLLKFMSIESVMPSNHLILPSPSPSAFNFSQHQGLLK